jgi:hypothetical protein
MRPIRLHHLPKFMNNQDYISHLAESKAIYHTQKAKVPFEEKLKIIIELQKMEMEMIKRNKSRKTSKKFRQVWICKT